jgi:hypothetical protein
MSKRLQIILTGDAWQVVESLCAEANTGFEAGHINYSDAINELVLCSKPDPKLLQIKHTNIRRSLQLLSGQKDIDLDTAIKSLMELRAKSNRKGPRYQLEQEGA